MRQLAAFVVLCLALVLVGCSHPAVRLQQGATIGQGIVHAAHTAFREVQPSHVELTRAELVETYRQRLVTFRECLEAERGDCADPGEADVWMDRWQEDMAASRAAEDALYTADGALVNFSRQLARWQDAGDADTTPEYVRAACDSVAAAFQELLANLRRFEIDYPSGLDQFSQMISPACNWGVGMFEEETDEE